ncbi:hypothetical protein HMPREF0083_05119 [Aneurinibacillus aneurinilyticus ATCC 12856]|uniref:Uncharacterized protein n=1 Tax=Aneurinibacillus aneurinilyticus ATCC 12856 TaxID=649747 RepID=U1Y3K2_ANEAE|nr:hypothetical protein HMPREF0083_05119 [Aneurinibacillus aneurinilyticus ATCC 12856]
MDKKATETFFRTYCSKNWRLGRVLDFACAKELHNGLAPTRLSFFL